MRTHRSPVPDPADAGRGARHALQALIVGLSVLPFLVCRGAVPPVRR